MAARDFTYPLQEPVCMAVSSLASATSLAADLAYWSQESLVRVAHDRY
jgi:hypothetical protein